MTADWRQIQWTFEANVAETRLALDMGVVAGATCFVDNITLVATGLAGPQPVELLPNGGFELGDGDDFTDWTKLNAADLMKQTTNPGEVRNGAKALRAVGFGTDHWRTQLRSATMATVVGKRYTASFWIKADASSPGVGGIVRMSTAGNSSPQYQDDATVSAEWQEIEWTITATGTETAIVLDLGKTENAVYFIDDASFMELPD